MIKCCEAKKGGVPGGDRGEELNGGAVVVCGGVLGGALVGEQ